jgi:hypothetical protein
VVAMECLTMGEGLLNKSLGPRMKAGWRPAPS